MTAAKGETPGTPVRRSRRLSTASLKESDLVHDVNHEVNPKKKKKEKQKVSKNELEVDHEIHGSRDLGENDDEQVVDIKKSASSSRKTDLSPNMVTEASIESARAPLLTGMALYVVMAVTVVFHVWFMYKLYATASDPVVNAMGEGGKMNLIGDAIPLFLITIFIELLYDKYYNLRVYRLNDTLGSLSLGSYSQFSRKLWTLNTAILPYAYIWSHYRLTDIFEKNMIGFAVMFVLVEFAYYWVHRTGHTFHCFWAMHGVHHTSEEYNLSTALRQSTIHALITPLYHLPSALLFPPKYYYLQAQFNLLYQFWLHTAVVPKLGPLEYVFNTPSQHRVHHGRNDYCIDKNYGGTLCVFDRLFNSFAEERENEPVVYGVTHGLESFDPVHGNWELWRPMIAENGVTTWYDTILRFYYGPGWIPGTHPYQEYTIPEVTRERQQKFDPKLPWGVQCNAAVQFLVPLVSIFFIENSFLPSFMKGYETLIIVYSMFHLYCVAMICNRSKFVPLLQIIRALLALVLGFHIAFCNDAFKTKNVFDLLSPQFKKEDSISSSHVVLGYYLWLVYDCTAIFHLFLNRAIFSIPLSEGEVGRDRSDEEVLEMIESKKVR